MAKNIYAIKSLLTNAVVGMRAIAAILPEAVDPSREGTLSPRPRLTCTRLALAAAARASATRLKTAFLPAATIASPEKMPDLMEGAKRGGGSDPARLFRPSASWLGG
jgi:predicted component of type VI protein secretion system